MRPSKVETFMTVAAVLSMRSTCVRKRVGCIILDTHWHIVGSGYNGPAAGLAHCTSNPCPGALAASGEGWKCEALHAEWNALLQCPDPHAIRTVFVTTSPCLTCVKMLMNTGCKWIYYMRRHNSTDDARNLWVDNERSMQQVKASSSWVQRLDEAYPTPKTSRNLVSSMGVECIPPTEETRYCETFVADTMSDQHCLHCGETTIYHPVELMRDGEGRSMSVAHYQRLHPTGQ